MKQKQYLRVGQSAKNKLFGVAPKVRRGPSLKEDRTPLQMLVSQHPSISSSRLAVILIGVFTLAVGIILSSIPWLDYIIYKNLRLWNGTLSYYYWQKPGVVRLTKVWVFNLTNPDGFLNQGQKPRLEEVGPFVYRENMEKMNVKFHENGTVSFQHRKILHFVPEMSLPKDTKLIVPNIPLLTLASKGAELPMVLRMGLSFGLNTFYKLSVFNTVTAEQLMFGYEETLTKLANTFYPRGKRPPPQMGILLTRNKTLISDVQTIFTGHTSLSEFGLMDKLNGKDYLPYWQDAPCNSVRASEGSLFPPRDITKSDLVHLWDRDICRIMPLRYRGDLKKHGVLVGKYTPDDNIFASGDHFSDNKCFCPGKEKCPPDGVQSIRPCQFDAPLYLSFPHLLGVTDPKILNAVEGMKPDIEKHETVFLINPKLGVPLEGRVRIQVNLNVVHSNVGLVRKFPTILMPLLWVEEGAEDIPDEIVTLIYLATTVADIAGPMLDYGLIVTGVGLLAGVFVSSYRRMVFTRENLERGKAKLRRGSSFLVNGQHRLLILRDSYSLLNNHTAETSFDPDP